MRPTPISSRRHPIVQLCRRLAERRDRGAAVLLDGEHLVAEAVRAGVPIRDVLAVRPRTATVRAAAAHGAAVHEVPASVLAAASPVQHPSGVVAVAEWTTAPLESVIAGSDGLVVTLADVQDPGNVGAAIRTADALGAAGVIAAGATADPGGWKALRAAMGSTFRLPVARAVLSDAIGEARRRGYRVMATDSRAGQPLRAVRFDGPALVLFGNEGAGLPEEVVESADTVVTIPMRAGVDSLNVAVAAALVLYEAARQSGARPARRP